MGEHRCYQCGRTTFNGRLVKTYVGGRVLCKALRECRQSTANIRAVQALEFQWLYRFSDITLFRDNQREFMRRQAERAR